jgi:hypothetical protein
MARKKDPLALKIEDRDLRRLLGTFSKMDEIAKNDMREIATKIAQKNALAVQAAASGAPNPNQARAVASSIESVSTSKDPTIKIYRSRRVTSNGTQAGYLFPGSEFGSNKFKQFPARSERYGRGNQGYWLYKTLRTRQPEILREWLDSYKLIRDEWIGRI